MVNLAGFVLGSAIARREGLSDDEAARVGLVAALMPSPLLGALIVQALTPPEAPRRRRRPRQPTQHPSPTREQIEKAQKQAIQELEKLLDELRQRPPT